MANPWSTQANKSAIMDTQPGASRLPGLAELLLGLLWIIDGVLQFQPRLTNDAFAASFLGYGTIGTPPPVANLLRWALPLLAPHGAALSLAVGAFQLALGVSLVGLVLQGTWVPRFAPLSKRHNAPIQFLQHVALLTSAGWALVVWVFGEGMGAMLLPGASMLTGAPGAALVYFEVSLLLFLQIDQHEPPSMSERPTLWGWAWALTWLIPSLVQLVSSVIHPNALSEGLLSQMQGEPVWLAHCNAVLASVAGRHPLVVSVVVLIGQGAIGISVLWATTRPWLAKAGLYTGALLSLCYFVLGQDFGGLLTGSATDVSLGPVMVILAVVVYWRALVLPKSQVGLGIPRATHASVAPKSIPRLSATTAMAPARDTEGS